MRRKGLGKFLIQLLELIGHKTDMKKVVLTVFKGIDGYIGYTSFWSLIVFLVDRKSCIKQVFQGQTGVSGHPGQKMNFMSC